MRSVTMSRPVASKSKMINGFVKLSFILRAIKKITSLRVIREAVGSMLQTISRSTAWA